MEEILNALVLVGIVFGIIAIALWIAYDNESPYCHICNVYLANIQQIKHPDLKDKVFCINCYTGLVEDKAEAKLKREIEENSYSNKPAKKIEKLSIIDRAEIAREVTTKFDFKKIREIRDFLPDDTSIVDSVRILHESLKSEYEVEIEKRGLIRSEISDENWNREMESCMALGEKYLVDSQVSSKIETAMNSAETSESKTINKDYSWKELKDRNSRS